MNYLKKKILYIRIYISFQASTTTMAPTTIVTHSPGNCTHWRPFRCGNGNCVGTSEICDGVNDCQDWTDEMECGEFALKTGRT